MTGELHLTRDQLKFLRALSVRYPNEDKAAGEIINLQAILNLPRGTEHFLADLHGEAESFLHILKNASGVIRDEIEKLFGSSMTVPDKNALATLIYYPEEKLDLVTRQDPNPDDWYKITLYRLVQVCRSISSIYTRSKVRKAIPADFTYIIEELLQNERSGADKSAYYDEIIRTIIDLGQARAFIITISNLIQRLAIDRLHIIGDIFDRGPHPGVILDILMRYHSVDIEWGNHDILWIGACAGSDCCIANVLRISLRYGNLGMLENDYGINLLPLATFAMQAYRDDPCQRFLPAMPPEEKDRSPARLRLIAQMHKAITILQFKLEAAAIRRRPELRMESRLLLDKIDFDAGTVTVDGRLLPLADTRFPTVHPGDPFALTPEEADLTEKLRSSFRSSERLSRHCRFLLASGGMYHVENRNLLYHGCVPLTEKGHLKSIPFYGRNLHGRALLDAFDEAVRNAFFSRDAFFSHNALSSRGGDRQKWLDLVWYLWCGRYSPLFGKSKMATFERYFTDSKAAQAERKDPYYALRDDAGACARILQEFGLDPTSSRIINGHVPVEEKNGESPVKAGGRMLVIDGGFARAYQCVTGLAGYTLVSDSYGVRLISHQPFVSVREAVENDLDIVSSTREIERAPQRLRVRDTDVGAVIRQQIDDLRLLLAAYRKGIIASAN